MSIDTTAPRSRRALLFGALGGAVASMAAFARPATTRAGVDGDVILDATNTGSGTTEIISATGNPALSVTGGSLGMEGIADAADASVIGVLGHATSGVGVAAVAGAGTALTADAAAGHAIRGTSTASHAIRGRGQLDGVIGESPGGRSGIVGYSGGGSAPAGPGKTGVYGEATQDSASRGVSGYSLAGQGVRGEATTGQGVQGVATSGTAVKADSTSGLALLATSTLGNAVRGHGQLDGVIGESPGNAGVVGFSGAGSAPAGPVKTGVYGEATVDSTARGVFGRTTSGNALRGEATSGAAVRAIATTGFALDASGKVRMNRSGVATIAAGKDSVDVTVPGGLGINAFAFANLQIKRSGVYVAAVRPAYPSASQIRIYLNKVASTSVSTKVGWLVLS
jgi:hypothetical protein